MRATFDFKSIAGLCLALALTSACSAPTEFHSAVDETLANSSKRLDSLAAGEGGATTKQGTGTCQPESILTEVAQRLAALGELIGQLCVKEQCSGDQEAKRKQIADRIQEVFAQLRDENGQGDDLREDIVLGECSCLAGPAGTVDGFDPDEVQEHLRQIGVPDGVKYPTRDEEDPSKRPPSTLPDVPTPLLDVGCRKTPPSGVPTPPVLPPIGVPRENN